MANPSAFQAGGFCFLLLLHIIEVFAIAFLDAIKRKKGNRNGQGARDCANDKADRDREHVDQHDVFQHKRVGEVQHEKEDRDESEFGID